MIRKNSLLRLATSFSFGNTVRFAVSAILDETVRDYKGRLAELKGRYEGQRCFIMGNGPSLNNMDLSMFENEIVWGSNKCFLLFDRIKWRPKFYVGVDTRVIPDIREPIHRVERELPQTTFFFPLTFRLKGVLRSRENVYWFNKKPRNPAAGPLGKFTPDASSRVFSAATVSISMMQLAAYLGFSHLYLIGCDTNYTIPATVRTEGKAHQLVSTKNDDPNHFSADYFGAGSKWHPPDQEKMMEHYQWAKEACDQLGVQVSNATVGGKLEVFPRVDYLRILQN
jgi:hypothetical protein